VPNRAKARAGSTQIRGLALSNVFDDATKPRASYHAGLSTEGSSPATDANPGTQKPTAWRHRQTLACGWCPAR
jgi:hypothetical protein